MRFIVYGAGAVGGVIGGRLFQQGHDVTLIARGPHLDALRDRGLRLETPEESLTLPIPAVARPGDADPAPGDIVLLTMKTQDTGAALAELSAVAPPDIVVGTAQNGVENERLALRLFSRVYAICVLLPAVFLEPGAVRAHVGPVNARLYVGRYPGSVDDTARALAAAFADANLAGEPSAEVMRLKYGKLLTNLGNAVEAVLGPGEHGHEIVRLAREEGEACLRAEGIDAPRGVSLESQMRPVGGHEHPGGSSAQSLYRGTGTIEADYLNGEIVLLGRRHGVPTPVNESLRRLANRMARERRRPGLMTPGEFLAQLESGPLGSATSPGG
jgi:2-dehydropantoate 2-reductase